MKVFTCLKWQPSKTLLKSHVTLGLVLPAWNNNHREPPIHWYKSSHGYWPVWNDNHRKLKIEHKALWSRYLTAWNDNHRKPTISFAKSFGWYWPTWNDNQRELSFFNLSDKGGIYLLEMTTIENYWWIILLGIYLLEMTTNENVKADGFDYVDGIDLLEMTTTGNGCAGA